MSETARSKNQEKHQPEESIPSENDQLQLLRVDEFAFDEMNLVEIPFCTLQRHESDKNIINLSPDGEDYLSTTGQKYGLPTALAEPVVLGLMWLTMDKNRFNSPKVKFSLRELVEDYMYPSKFDDYRAGGRLMKAVEKEMHRIAAARLRSNRWYDRSQNQHVEIDAAIIDSITVRKKGGNNSNRVLEIVWGNKVYDSVRARYTKGFDVKTYLQITQPLDRRLYRWLDRQLARNEHIIVRSCQTWAKHKLLMQGVFIEKGGRTASNYILSKIKKAIRRLKGLNFAVRLTANQIKPDFSFRFDKIAGENNEVVEADPTGDLVFEFRRVFHGSKKKRKLKEGDRQIASRWIDSYGFDKSVWMVNRCKKLHLSGKMATKTLFALKALEFYESCAEADYERMKDEEDGQLNLNIERERWDKRKRYVEVMLAEADRTLDLEDLQTEAESRVGDLNLVKTKSGFARDKVLEIELKRLKLERLGAVPEEEFMSFWSDEDLAQALEERHGGNPIQ